MLGNEFRRSGVLPRSSRWIGDWVQSPWRWSQRVPPKRHKTLVILHYITPHQVVLGWDVSLWSSNRQPNGPWVTAEFADSICIFQKRATCFGFFRKPSSGTGLKILEKICSTFWTIKILSENAVLCDGQLDYLSRKFWCMKLVVCKVFRNCPLLCSESLGMEWTENWSVWYKEAGMRNVRHRFGLTRNLFQPSYWLLWCLHRFRHFS
jgi:hypothetical protein